MTVDEQDRYIRGVNLGGWLVLERYIVPYQFSVTDCHVRGDLCWYPQQASAPPIDHPDYQPCDRTVCQPVRIENAFGNMDYPVDEKTLADAFLSAAASAAGDSSSTATSSNNTIGQQREIAERWFNYHFENFIKFEDLQKIKAAGITHLRVPLPHWIRGDVRAGESWIVGKRWEVFLRLCKWARTLDLQVWPDIHTAPGSQNGFDNSGEALPYMTCQVWSNNPALVQRSLDSLTSIVQGIAHAGFADVVTGFGLLNEPFADCDKTKYLDFIDRGKTIVRRNLGNHVAIYVSDMFQDSLWNDGQWWLDPTRHANTYLDSHYYQCFDESTRALSPRQHIAFTCQRQYERATSCCYDDAPDNTVPSKGVSRMIGEWSASFDILPAAPINEIMDVIATTGRAPYMDRTLSADRQDFLRDYVKAQMVSYEDAGYKNHAWFYWSVKMENAAFAEWDFLRGIQDGWFPNPVLPADTPSMSEYGTCYDLLLAIPDNRTVVHEFPAPEDAVPSEHEATVDDDIVLSHGESLLDPSIHSEKLHPQQIKIQTNHHHRHHSSRVGLPTVLLLAAILAMVARYFLRSCERRSKYTPIGSSSSSHSVTIFPCDRKNNSQHHPSSPVKTAVTSLVV